MRALDIGRSHADHSPMPALPSPAHTALPWRLLSWVASLALLGVAAWVLHRYLTQIAWHDVAHAWRGLSWLRIGASVLGAVISLAMLAMFDVLAARVAVGARVSARLAGFAGAVTQAISNTLGFHALTGSALRYRIYATAGLRAGDVARIVGVAGLGVGLGFAVVITGALCWEPLMARGYGRLPGLMLLVALAALLVWLGQHPRTLRLWRWRLAFPGAGVAALQMLLGAVEMLAAIGALYVLLPSEVAPPFIDFVPVYVGAVLAGIVSHAPGGLGVFEMILLAAFPAKAHAPLLAAMLCYRVTYNMLPFALASLALALFEWRRRAMAHAQLDGG